MMGSSSGSCKVGGSLSSSSNLSPLAPPFMVNKSTSTNPSMNFSEFPAYGTVFDSSGPFSAVGHKFGATEPPVTTTCPPSGGVYGYLGRQSSNLDYYVEQNTGYDPFSYDQFPSNISNCNGSSYDLLSSSRSGLFNGYSSPQVDHTHDASSGEECKAKWGGFWGGLGNDEHEKCMQYAPNSGLNDFHISNLPDNKSPFGDPIDNSRSFDDASSKSRGLGEVGNQSNPKQGASVTQGLDSHGAGSTSSGNSFDIFNGMYHLGSFGIHNQSQNTSFKNLASSSSDCSRMSSFVSEGPSLESLCFERPVNESFTPFNGSKKVNGSSSEDNRLGQTGYYMFGGSTSYAASTLSGIQVKSVTSEIAPNTKPSARLDLSYPKQPQMPLGVEFQPGVAIRRPFISSMFGSSIHREEAVNAPLDVKSTSDKPNLSPQLPCQFNSDGFAPKTKDSKVECSAEKHSSGSDLHNPAEDSPCWKGASSTRFSPFSSVSEAVIANVFRNQEDVNASDSMCFSSEKVNESTFPQKPAVPSSLKSYCIDLNIPEGLEFLDDCHGFIKDSSILNDQRSVSDAKLSSDTKQIFKENEVTSSLEASVAAKSTPTGAQSSSRVQSKAGNDSSCFFLGEKSGLKHNQSVKENPESRFDIDDVLKTMTKLSQMLYSYCSGNSAALTCQHLVTIQQIVSNVKAAQTSPTKIFPKPDIHFWEGFTVPEMLNYDELMTPCHKQADPDKYFRQLSKSLDTFQDYNMTQGIKKILSDNLHDGIYQPEISYKNLWLEAEAALCVMTTKARFNRMKIEMEKNSQHGMKDKENQSSPKKSSDKHGPVPLAFEDKISPELECKSQKTSTTKLCNDTGEIHVSNSHHPCLSSMKVNIPKKPIKELNFPQFSYQMLKSRGEDDSLATLNNDDGKRCSYEDVLSQDTSCIDAHDHDVGTPVTARYQILNSCVDDPGTLKRNDECEKHSSGQENYGLSRIREKNDVETSMMARYQILKCRMESSESLYDSKESPQEEDCVISVDPSSPNRHVLNPKLFESNASTSSVMDRFRVIQNRVVGSSNSARKDPPQENRAEEEKDKSSFMSNIFGTYPNYSENDEYLKKLSMSVSASVEPLSATSYKTNKLRPEIFEDWYENDCSSDWEHVSKEDVRSKN